MLRSCADGTSDRDPFSDPFSGVRNLCGEKYTIFDRRSRSFVHYKNHYDQNAGIWILKAFTLGCVMNVSIAAKCRYSWRMNDVFLAS